MKSTGVELTMFASSTPALDHIDFLQKSHFRKDKRLELQYKIQIQICQISLKTLCQAGVIFKAEKRLKI